MLFNSLYTQRNNCWDCIFNGRCYIMVNSRLEKKQLALNNLPPMPHWQEALKEFLSIEFNN